MIVDMLPGVGKSVLVLNGAPRIYSHCITCRETALTKTVNEVSGHYIGGSDGTRTRDPLHAMQVRYQLRHRPMKSEECSTDNFLSLQQNLRFTK